MTEEKSIANKLANNLKLITYESKSGTPLFFDQYAIADKYAELFEITDEKDIDSFRNAFLVATEGQGGEINKINSIVSSALLPLLVFFRLFGKNDNENNIVIKLDGLGNVVFDKCYFEVRNKVIKPPSCVDVALYSSNDKVLLFLESKFTEYFTVTSQKKYGKGYIKLYESELIKGALSPYIKVESTRDNLVLTSTQKCYIEGIKQSISHLIGLVRGPQTYEEDNYTEGYSKEYFEDYSKCYYEENLKIYYGTILFDPKDLGQNRNAYNNYVKLYENTIGANGSSIVKAIKEWDKGKHDNGKIINVLESPINYQDLFSNAHNQRILVDNVKTFYKF